MMSNEELVTRIKAGINTADNMLQLWEQTKRFIHVLAKRYQSKAEIEDLEQEGYLALYDAVDGYKPEKGVKFLTYAEYWIKLRMIRYIQKNTTVRIPVNEWVHIREYNKMVNAFQSYLNRKPTRHEIACNMGLTYEQVTQLEKSVRMGRIESLDAPLSDEIDGTLCDTVASDIDIEEMVLDDVAGQQLEADLWMLVDSLPDTQGDVIRMRYRDNKTFDQIGEEIGMKIGKVRSINQKALCELRYSDDMRMICECLPDSIGSKAYYGSVGSFNRTWTSSTEYAALKLG